jgi:hypothetical protein
VQEIQVGESKFVVILAIWLKMRNGTVLGGRKVVQETDRRIGAAAPMDHGSNGRPYKARDRNVDYGHDEGT